VECNENNVAIAFCFGFATVSLLFSSFVVVQKATTTITFYFGLVTTNKATTELPPPSLLQ
jgi:hypothetical protein